MKRILVLVSALLFSGLLACFYFLRNKSTHTTTGFRSNKDSVRMIAESMHLFLTREQEDHAAFQFVKQTPVFESFKHEVTAHTKTQQIQDTASVTKKSSVDVNTDEPIAYKGKELTHSSFSFSENSNTRERLVILNNTFKEGDYITGTELGLLYAQDKSLNKVVRTTLSHFLEKNIRSVQKSGRSLIINTMEPEGIHTTIKIPLLTEFSLHIKNKASIVLGDLFVSKEPLFVKSYLLPVEFKDMEFIQNGAPIPVKGYVSGNYYFIEYSQSKIAYKIR